MSKRPVALSEYDRIQAIKRHPEFCRELTAWRDLFERERKPDYCQTEEDAARNYGPRSYWSMEAELEASRYQSLSIAERWHVQMKADSGIAAFRTLTPRYGESEVTVTIPINQPVNTMLRMLERVLKYYRERDDIADTQPLKPTEVDPWLVWDEHIVKGKSLTRIAQELVNCTDHPTVNNAVKASYGRVKRAFDQARRMMRMIEPESAPAS